MGMATDGYVHSTDGYGRSTDGYVRIVRTATDGYGLLRTYYGSSRMTTVHYVRS